MVKKGPCFHCGINSTPLWRNGPTEKPVLCNACGSRYKLKGHLDNYLPKNFQLLSHHNNFPNVPPTDFGNKIPSRKRSLVVYKQMTPMEEFQKELLNLYKCDESSPEEILLLDNVNNFIPTNEIGLGAILLKTDVASTDPGSSTCSSVDNSDQCESSTTVA